jgi:hypothetical protein
MPDGSSLLLVLLITPSLCVPETAASGSSNAVVAAVKLSDAGAMPSLQGHLSPVAGSSRQGHSALSAQMVAVPGTDAGEAGLCRLLPQLARCEFTTQLSPQDSVLLTAPQAISTLCPSPALSVTIVCD